jgi:hypothetical protein
MKGSKKLPVELQLRSLDLIEWDLDGGVRAGFNVEQAIVHGEQFSFELMRSRSCFFHRNQHFLANDPLEIARF